MKNLKKLFVVLPLVLVMLFAALPVYAADPIGKIKVGTELLNVSFGKDDHYFLNAGTRWVPVWAAEKATYATTRLSSQGAGWIKLLNDGKPVSWLQASGAVSNLQIGQYAAENLDWFKNNDYILPSYKINHVEEVTTKVTVPYSWTVNNLAVNCYVKGNQHKLVEKGQFLPKTDALITSKIITIDDGTKKATFNGQLVDVTPGKAKVGEEKKEVEGYTFQGDIYEFVDKQNITFDYNLSLSTEALRNFGNGAEIKVTVKSKAVDKGDVSIDVKIGDEPDHFTEVDLNGILVIVEKGSVNANVKHHYVLANGEEIVKEATETISKYDKVDENSIPMAWLNQLEGFEYDPTRTVVEQKFDDKTLTAGEKFNDGYNVDLFYVAAAEDEDGEIDAAFGNTAAGVENQGNVANLPATGAASNVAVILSSVALVVVGLFLKK